MPEGPEIKLVVYNLNYMIGYTMKDVKIISGKYTKQKSKATTICGLVEFKKALPMKITAIECHGKFMYWTFEHGWYAFITLGLSGRVLIDQETTHKRVEFITDKHVINYSDQLNFGTIHFYKGKSILDKKLKTLGVDLLNNYNLKKDYEFISKKIKKIKNQKKTIAEIMLNQKIFSGVGTYIYSESLYEADISPFTEIKNISDYQLKCLIKIVHNIMTSSYKAQLKCLKKDGYNYKKLTKCYKFKIYKRKETDKGEKILHDHINKRAIWYVKK
jgi:formamidopyrimidine-DNA glycosylase